MRKPYEAPRVVAYGRVEALTASSFKCTGGSDAFYANQRTGIEPVGGDTIFDESTGGVIDPDGCNRFTLS
ncbi:MAG: lasso RiPP family leader peptide-containing protein [Dehalococcoidia bacterium]